MQTYTGSEKSTTLFADWSSNTLIFIQVIYGIFLWVHQFVGDKLY